MRSTGLQKPPKREQPGKVLGRVMVLAILATIAGAAIYTATTIQRADLTETARPIDLELDSPVTWEGLRINTREMGDGAMTTVLVHDADVAGSIALEDLAESLAGRYRVVLVDLPGHGLSDRLPGEGPRHTVAGQAAALLGVLEQVVDDPVVLVGVGFGGEVAAEAALTAPASVAGLVLVDVDFWSAPDLEVTLQGMPWLGKAATYLWETGGQFALDRWAPHCEDGGWCPDAGQVARRAQVVSIEATTDSFFAFRRTPEAALAPSNLAEITVPTAYVWSRLGPVTTETRDRIGSEIDGVEIVEVDARQAHLEEPGRVGAAVALLSG